MVRGEYLYCVCRNASVGFLDTVCVCVCVYVRVCVCVLCACVCLCGKKYSVVCTFLGNPSLCYARRLYKAYGTAVACKHNNSVTHLPWQSLLML